eukprot:1111549-Lingulodinium_polyedra.AAC.1
MTAAVRPSDPRRYCRRPGAPGLEGAHAHEQLPAPFQRSGCPRRDPDGAGADAVPSVEVSRTPAPAVQLPPTPAEP